MIADTKEHEVYRAYRVRMWQVSCDDQVAWRTSAEDVHSGEQRAFADLTALFAFLEKAALSVQTIIQNKEHSDD